METITAERPMTEINKDDTKRSVASQERYPLRIVGKAEDFRGRNGIFDRLRFSLSRSFHNIRSFSVSILNKY